MVEIQNAAASCIFNLVCKSDKEELEALGVCIHAHMLAHARTCIRGRVESGPLCVVQAALACRLVLMLRDGAGCDASWLFALVPPRFADAARVRHFLFWRLACAHAR